MSNPAETCVLVEWLDAHASSQWMDPTDIDQEAFVVRSVGWLIAGGKPGHVVIAQSLGSDSQIDGVLSIPVGMVQKTIVLGYPTPPQTD
jgi:hypothetical protein